MADEHGATMIGGIETEIRGLVKDVAELKGTVAQMDKRLSNVETAIGGLRQEINDVRKDNKQSFHWILGIVLTTWMGTMWAILTKIH